MAYEFLGNNFSKTLEEIFCKFDFHPNQLSEICINYDQIENELIESFKIKTYEEKINFIFKTGSYEFLILGMKPIYEFLISNDLSNKKRNEYGLLNETFNQIDYLYNETNIKKDYSLFINSIKIMHLFCNFIIKIKKQAPKYLQTTDPYRRTIIQQLLGKKNFIEECMDLLLYLLYKNFKWNNSENKQFKNLLEKYRIKMDCLYQKYYKKEDRILMDKVFFEGALNLHFEDEHDHSNLLDKKIQKKIDIDIIEYYKDEIFI